MQSLQPYGSLPSKIFFKSRFTNKLFFKLFLFIFLFFFSFKSIVDAYSRPHSFVGIFIKRFLSCGLLWENLPRGIMHSISPRQCFLLAHNNFPTRGFMERCYVKNLLMNSFVAGNRIKPFKKISPKPNRLVFFNGDISHTGCSPKNFKNRILINSNYD